MNAFQKMVQDCFKVQQFVEYFTYENQQIKCIAYSVDYSPQIIAFGLDEGINFYLTCLVDDFTPKKNLHIKFRNQLFKVDKFILDPHGLSWKIMLKNSFKKQQTEPQTEQTDQ